MTSPSDAQHSGNKRHVLAGTVGNILEWYDFAIYGFLAPVISPLFFPDNNSMAGLIKTYGVFAAGYLMRPIGGVIFGHIGDRMGRKKALQLSIAMMAIPTVLVGLLPVYDQIGAWAAGLLILLRLLQGISVGGELIGSMSYLVETAPANRRGWQGSWSVCGGVAGILLGSLVATLLTDNIDKTALNTWGWRLPFLFGVVIFAVGSWLRRTLIESPDFTAAQATEDAGGNPLTSVLREMPLRILHMSANILLFATSFYTLFVWMPTYLTTMVDPPVEHALLVNTIAMSMLLLWIPASGRLSDTFGRTRVILTVTAILGVMVYPLFLFVDHGSTRIALMVQVVFSMLVGCIQGPLPAYLVESFPARNRYTAIGLSYNITLAIFGGTAPLVCTWLISATGDLASPAIYLAGLAAISFVSMALFKQDQSPTV
jgi:MHS family proline/betaine transporter-like MFS transporter